MANAIRHQDICPPISDASEDFKETRTVRFEEPSNFSDSAERSLDGNNCFEGIENWDNSKYLGIGSNNSPQQLLKSEDMSSDAQLAISTQPPAVHLPVIREPVPCLYKVGREIGRGTYSVVKEARHIETTQWYAAKVISKRLMRGNEHLVKNEIIVLKRVSKGHPNILTLVDYFETDNSLYLITELAKGGELFDRIFSRGSFLESDAAQLMKQITSGVAHLHAHGIVHRDLKPENLLFKSTSTSSNLLICDFGLSRIIDEENFRLLTTTVGTPSYMAPEIFTKKGHGKPVDIWALGVIAYLLLCGFTPFDRESPDEEVRAIERGEFHFTPEKYWMHVTSDARNFIKKCLQVDPSSRPTAEECLCLPFLTRKYRNRSDMTPTNEDSFIIPTSTTRGPPTDLDGMSMNGAYSSSPEPDKRTPIFTANWG